MDTSVLITGATGLVGYSLVKKLTEQRRHVKALVRSKEKAVKILPPNCELVTGNITDPESVLRAMVDCSIVYHAAGVPEQWVTDPILFERVNITGTQNVINAAIAMQRNIKKIIYISTVDLFLSEQFKPYNETMIDPIQRGTYYRKSKQEADRIVFKGLQQGLPAIFIHPSAVYGYSPVESFWFTKLIRDIMRKKMPFVPPGGLPLVFCEDLADGCFLAAEKAPIGERYILDESYHSFLELCDVISEELSVPNKFRVLPPTLAKTVAKVSTLISKMTKIPPPLHEGILDFMLSGNTPDSSKARTELGWHPLALHQGIRKTIAILKNQKLV